MAAAVTPKTRLVFIANPDNPTGGYKTEAELIRFLDTVGEKVPRRDGRGLLRIRERVGLPDSMALRARYPNLIILRTFSKAYGLAGMRLGYGIARPEIVDFVNRVRAPFNVSALAQFGGMAALEDQEHVRRTVELNRKGLAELAVELPPWASRSPRRSRTSCWWTSTVPPCRSSRLSCARG